MKIPICAAQNRQRGRMRPAGRQFDMPDVKSTIDKDTLFIFQQEIFQEAKC